MISLFAMLQDNPYVTAPLYGLIIVLAAIVGFAFTIITITWKWVNGLRDLRDSLTEKMDALGVRMTGVETKLETLEERPIPIDDFSRRINTIEVSLAGPDGTNGIKAQLNELRGLTFFLRNWVPAVETAIEEQRAADGQRPVKFPQESNYQRRT